MTHITPCRLNAGDISNFYGYGQVDALAALQAGPGVSSPPAVALSLHCSCCRQHRRRHLCRLCPAHPQIAGASAAAGVAAAGACVGPTPAPTGQTQGRPLTADRLVVRAGCSANHEASAQAHQTADEQTQKEADQKGDATALLLLRAEVDVQHLPKEVRAVFCSLLRPT